MSSKLQYASSHAANNATVKRVIADAGMSVDAKGGRTKYGFKIPGFAHHWQTSIVRRRCDEGKYFYITAPHGQAAESKPMQQTCVSVGSVTTAAAKCEMCSIVFIIELSYRIIIAIILIYHIVYRPKTVFDIS